MTFIANDNDRANGSINQLFQPKPRKYNDAFAPKIIKEI